MNICSVDVCSNPIKRGEYCIAHYNRWLRHGDPLGGRISPGIPRFCSVDGCGRIHSSRGFCDRHYRVFTRHGDPLYKVHFFENGNRTPVQVFEYHSRLKTVDEKGCWISKNKPSRQGYVSVSVVTSREKRDAMLHRVALAATIGFDLDSKETVHHKCANQPCFNPEHLQVVSQRENMAEMLERNFYLDKINELERTVANLKQQLEIRSIF